MRFTLKALVAITMPTPVRYYAYYACFMPTMSVLCLLYLHYDFCACTVPTMPVLCLLLYYACLVLPLSTRQSITTRMVAIMAT